MTSKLTDPKTFQMFFCPDFSSINNLRRWLPMEQISDGEAWDQMQFANVIFVSDQSHMIISHVSPLIFFDELINALSKDQAFLTCPDQHFDLLVTRNRSDACICKRHEQEFCVKGETEKAKAEARKCMYDALQFCLSVFPEIQQSNRFVQLKKKYSR